MSKTYEPTRSETNDFFSVEHCWTKIHGAVACPECGCWMASTWWRNYSVSVCPECDTHVWEVEG